MRILKAAVLSILCAASLAAQVDKPLEASLQKGVGEPVFHVNQQAYVAVFEVIPGIGVQQIFPRSSWQATQRVEPGDYLLSRPLVDNFGLNASWSVRRPVARPMYVTSPSGRVLSYYYSTSWTGDPFSGIWPARTLLMVASRQPLRLVSSPAAAANWLQHVVGFRAIANSIWTSEDMLQDIVEAILPAGSTPEDVVADVLNIESQLLDPVRHFAGQTISFACGNGNYAVPASYFFETGVYYCPLYSTSPVTPRRPPPIPDSVAPPIVPPGDPDEYKVPGRWRIDRNGKRSGSDLGGTNALDVTPRAGVTIGGAPPITYDDKGARGGINPATGGWVPPTRSATPSDYGYGTGRFTPASPNNRPTPDGSAVPRTSPPPAQAEAVLKTNGVPMVNNAPTTTVTPASSESRPVSRPKDP